MKSALYFADDQVRDAFFMLQSGRVEEKEIFNQLNSAFDTISLDPFCGIQVPKRLIPKIYITKYGINSLWKFNFHKNWRLMYSVAGDGTQVVTLVLEWLQHKEY
jgi:Txe/YoeB family toxin of Txe-Axe toxin-antitoxin module